MTSTSRCARCKSDRIIPRVKLIERQDYNMRGSLRAGVEGTPSGWIFKGLVEVDLQADICGACGFADIYAAEPDALWSAYQDSQRT
jgi:hypothetical protein